MSKFKYTITTPHGTFTRTSARKYSHIVIGNNETDASARASYASHLKHCRQDVAACEANVANDKGAREWAERFGQAHGDYSANRLYGSYLCEFDKNNPEHIKVRDAVIEQERPRYLGYLADAKKRLAEIEASSADQWVKNAQAKRGFFFELGFSSRRDLAEKLKNSQSERHTVLIIEITPEMVREIQPRAKKVKS